MKKASSAAAALFVALSAFAVEVDGTAARVGSAVILRSDIVGEMRRAGVGAEKYDEVRTGMIERQLMLQAATAAKLQMQDWVIENRIREIVSHAFDGDLNKLKAVLAKDRVSYSEWRQRLKEDMLVAAMRWQVVEKNVAATPAAMRDEYAAHPERYRADPRATVSVIFLKPEDLSKTEEIEGVIASDGFAEAARRYSADARAKDGGQWKDVKPEEVFRPEICKAIEALKVGETSKWVELDGWKFLIRKDAESFGGIRSFAEAYDDVAANVKAAESERLYKAWIGRLRDEAYIKVY